MLSGHVETFVEDAPEPGKPFLFFGGELSESEMAVTGNGARG